MLRQAVTTTVVLATLLLLLLLYNSDSPLNRHQYSQYLRKAKFGAHLTPAAERFQKTPTKDRDFLTETDTCSCQSMFTLGGCGLEEVASLRQQDSSWVAAVNGLAAARYGQDEQMIPHLATLARYLPRLFKVNVTRPVNISSPPEIKVNPNITRATSALPFIPCRIHVYSAQEVASCTRHYQAKRGQPLRIAFVGDSRVRNTMQQMIRGSLDELKFKLAGEMKYLNIKLAFLDSKTKNNAPVIGNGIELRLHWSAFIERNRQPEDQSRQGARDLLEAWASGTQSLEDGPVPDIIYTSSGLWDTAMMPEDAAVEEYMNTLHEIVPILKQLSKQTRILWHIHGPEKKWLATRDVANGALDLINVAAWIKLRDSNIWFWDTHTVMALRQYSECLALNRAGLDKLMPHSWGCHDFNHAGRDVEDAAANMLWNLACNRELHLTTQYCCS